MADRDAPGGEGIALSLDETNAQRLTWERLRARRPLCEREPNRAGECDCMRLARPLAHEETLPDHASEAAMRASCRNWSGVDLGIRARPDVSPQWLPIGSDLTSAPLDRNNFHWPVSVEFSRLQLMLVLRQWVEEPDEKLVGVLKGMPAWEHVMDALRVRFGDLETGRIAAWAKDADLVARVKSQSIEATTRGVLATRGLPATLGTARFALQEIDGEPWLGNAAIPTRGVLVTSFALRPDVGGLVGAGELADVLPGRVVTQICGQHPWDSADLYRAAGPVIQRHADWWEREGCPTRSRAELLLQQSAERGSSLFSVSAAAVERLGEVGGAQIPDGTSRRQAAGRRDELTLAVRDFVAGRMTREELEATALDRSRTTAGDAWSPLEERRALKNLRDRIRRAEKKN